MSCWDILGIEPSVNTRTIKRAYAARLSAHHPEDDPAGAQRVQGAYEEALAYVRRHGEGDRCGTERALRADEMGESYGEDVPDPPLSASVETPVALVDGPGTSAEGADDIPEYVLEERRHRACVAAEARAWVKERERLIGPHVGDVLHVSTLIPFDDELVPPAEYWSVEGFDVWYSRLVAALLSSCSDLDAIEEFELNLPEGESQAVRRVCDERAATLRASHVRRGVRLRTVVALACVVLAFGAFASRGVLDAGEQREARGKRDEVQEQIDVAHELAAESQTRSAEREAVEAALARHQEQNDVLICKRLSDMFGREFVMKEPSLRAEFPSVGDRAGRATCTALSADGEEFIVLVEFGADGVVTDVVMAEPFE